MTAEGGVVPGPDADAPWVGLDGPAVVASAAALQLLPANAPGLVRAERLAAVGCALPSRAGTPTITPSRLRALLVHLTVGGEAARAQEDTFDDVYVDEVMFHGGPRLVLQGLVTGISISVFAGRPYPTEYDSRWAVSQSKTWWVAPARGGSRRPGRRPVVAVRSALRLRSLPWPLPEPAAV